MALLGATITFAGRPLYAPHEFTTFAWGLTPLQDQQLGGAIMWIPAGAVFVAAILFPLGGGDAARDRRGQPPGVRGCGGRLLPACPGRVPAESASGRRRRAGAARRARRAHGADFAPNDPPGEWRRQARDYANTRYSPLDQVNTGNVARLKVAWSFSDGIPYGHEAAPLVVGDTMYVVTPYPEHRLCPRPDQAGRADQMDLPAASDADRRSARPAATRSTAGPTYADGKLVYTLLDGEAVAVDANDRQGGLAHQARRPGQRHDR